MTLAIGAASVALLLMLVETIVSRRNERALRRRGAVEPDGDVYATMRWAYPAAFVLMALEGLIAGPPSWPVAAAGVALFAAAKALKWWAVAALGTRWTFRVLVLPDVPLVNTGPYAWLRHPNYVAVAGELAAMALVVGARITGPVATVLFSLLMWRRMRVEERALRYPPCT